MAYLVTAQSCNTNRLHGVEVIVTDSKYKCLNSSGAMSTHRRGNPVAWVCHQQSAHKP